VSANEELLGRKGSGSSLKTENTAMEIHCSNNANTLSPERVALTSPTSGSRSVGIVRSRTNAMGFVVCFVSFLIKLQAAFQSKFLY
jgi:hypothetical protein